MTPLRSCVASPSIGTSSTVEQGTLHCKAAPPLQRLKFSGGNPEIPPRTLWRFADPAVDATPLLLLVHHAVFQRAVIRRAELPTERFRVELSQDARVAPQDLEMDDRIPHLVLHWANMRCLI